jgi:predicted ATPase
MGTNERSPFGKLLRDGRITAEVSQEPLAEPAEAGAIGISGLENATPTGPRLDTMRLLPGDSDLDGPSQSALPKVPWQPLPVPTTPLVGREREVGAAADLLCNDNVRLVTLTGPGGIGKTRLALAVAHHLIDHFTDGIAFIDLSPVRDITLVLPTLAAAFGVQESGGQGLAELVATVLRDRQILLVFDNCEQVVDAAPDIATVVGSCPALKVLATSRVALRLTAEHVVPIPPLQLPDAATVSSLSHLARREAVAMFVDRAQAADPAFTLTNTNAGTITTLVHRLDGLPLAIALAAARIWTLPPRALLARIERRLDVLTDGPRDAPARLRDMRDAIAWSYDLLTRGEQMLFRRLAVFVGGFTLEAARIVAGDGQDVMRGVSALVTHSLVSRAAGRDEESFTMLETIRAYALEQLAASGELQEIQQRQASWSLAIVEAVEAEHIGPGPPSAPDRLGPNRDNLRAALQWLREHGGIGTGLRLASTLWPLWLERGEISEGRVHLTAYLATPQASANQDAWARAVSISGALAQAQGDHQQAVTLRGCANRCEEYVQMSETQAV